MVTYAELIQICILVVVLSACLCRQKRSDRRHPDKYGDHIVEL